MSDVSLVKCDSYEKADEAIRRAVDLLGGFRKVAKKGSYVVIKPNLVNGARPETAVTTHPSVVVSLVRLAKEAGAGRVDVAENMGGRLQQGRFLSILVWRRLFLGYAGSCLFG